MSPKISAALVLPPPIELTDYAVNSITGCWIWLGRCDRRGYPIDSNGRFVDLQIYREHKGKVPAEYEVSHLCWYLACVNPDHLGVCPGVFEFNRGRPGKRLNMALAREIRAKAGAGMPKEALSAQYSVAVSTIRSILLNNDMGGYGLSAVVDLPQPE